MVVVPAEMSTMIGALEGIRALTQEAVFPAGRGDPQRAR
jgi:hypothetical protein